MRVTGDHSSGGSTPAQDIRSESDGEKVPQGSHAHLEHTALEHDPDELNDVHNKLTKETILACIAIAGQINAYVMSLLIPSTTLSYINQDLGPSPYYSWITIVWQLGGSIIVSISGRLSDIFGRRYFMITGASISIVGCLVGANGKSIDMMIASGTLFGIGSGFQEMAYACIQEMLPNKHRMVGVGLLDISLAIAFSSPAIAYCFIAFHDIGWRGAYWYMFTWHVVAFIFLWIFYRPPDFKMKHRHDGKTKMQLLAELDYVGIFLFITGGVLFLLGINFGGRQYSWNSAATITPIILGISSYVALGFWEVYSNQKYPLLPPKLFMKVREFLMVIVVCFVGGMLYYSMNVLWPRQSQTLFVGADQPILRGGYATFFSIGSWLGGVTTVFVCSWLGHEKWQLVFFMVVQTALIGSLSSVGVDDRVQAIVTLIIGSAMVTAPQLVSFAMLSLGLEDQSDIGIAVGLAGTFRLLGGAVATAIYSAILSTKLSQALPGQMTVAIEDSDVSFSSSLLKGLVTAAATNTKAAFSAIEGATPRLVELALYHTKLANVEAFRLVYLVAIGFGGLATFCAFCTVSIDSHLKNSSRAIVLKNEIKGDEDKTAQAA
ncbi:unnamed protein product [Clonostachys chloroleuca]|uniref:Major facilitator superfamily (MFS) profile domain-containing protein n=1 Tax=Clonostachys chloroleuca TaxID=1926264 RepID=A0AA35PXG0_9HYPO|nr:unnamed protein product [Clonostachys chloroleuca]